MAAIQQPTKKARKAKTPRSGGQKVALTFATQIREAGTVLREHVRGGYDIPVEARNAIYACQIAISQVMSQLGSVKFVQPNGEQAK